MKEFIDAGICDETFLWNPIELGYAASYAAVALINGDITASVGDTFTVPEVGDLVVEQATEVNENGELVEADGTIAYLNRLNTFNVDTVNDWVEIL